jgi:hypothetical protein
MTIKDTWFSNIRPAALSDKYCDRYNWHKIKFFFWDDSLENNTWCVLGVEILDIFLQ